MKAIKYLEIVCFIEEYSGYTKDLATILERKHPDVPKDTLISIVSNEIQKGARKSHFKSTPISDAIYNKYLDGREKDESLQGANVKLDRKKLLRIASCYRLPPTLVARIVLSRFLEKKEKDEIVKPTKKTISDMLSKPHLIDDADMSLEVYWSILYDDFYSPIGDIVKNQMGYEYECKLRYHCKLAKLAYKDENTLKKEGYDKTPDIKLELPIMINNIPIMWIESKALFADEEIHNTYIKDQYDCYWNRWGPGIVIYWFGFHEDIGNASEKRFIVIDSFPSNDSITHLNCSEPDFDTIEQMKKLSCESYGIEENWD